MTEQSLLQIDGFRLDGMIADSIELLKECEPPEGYWGAFSGGKDSCVIKELAKMAGVKVEWHYSVTTIDPPELIYFMREHHADVAFDRPEKNFFTKMVEKGYPTRRARWCCEVYKESRAPAGRVLILGIRGEESKARAKRWKDVTHHNRTGAAAVSPILRWRSEHVWAFIRAQGVPYCSLYDEGFDRIGCIGCPMARADGRKKEFARWPKYEKAWRRAFRRLWENRGSINGFDSWESLFDWWLSNDSFPGGDDCQLDMWSND